MAKVQIKSEEVTPFGGIFHVRELFSRYMAPIIDKVLGLRCASYGYQYSEIVGSLSSVYFCGGDCVEDVTSHLMPRLSLHPTLRTCSSDTILRGISELATSNTSYTSDTGKSYDFNTAPKLNSLLVHYEGNRGILQPQRWQRMHLRRHEQRLRMGQAAKVLHGREHRFSAADGNDTQLLQVPYGQAGHKSLRTEKDKPNQSLRVQVHQRASQVDKNSKAL